MVQSSFNGHLVLSATEHSAEKADGGLLKRLPAIERCEIEVLSSGPPPDSRYMVDRTESRVTLPPFSLAIVCL